MVRPAVEAALEVARNGLLLNPPEHPPAGLRRFLSFSKLSPPAVRAIAKVVDSDDEFRSRVAASVDEDGVGRAGWLWLTRPDGWKAEVADLEAERTAAVSAAAEERSERNARRKLASAQDAAERATATAKELADEADGLRAELAEERVRTVELEGEVARLHDSTALLQEERNRAVRELKDVEARLAARSAEHNRAKQRIRELEDEAAAASTPQAPQSMLAAPPEVVGPTTVLDSDSAAAIETLSAAVSGAEAVAASLARLGDLLAKGQPDRQLVTRSGADEASTSQPPGQRSGEPAEPHSATPGTSDTAAIQVPRRTPLKLPGGVLDDTVEAADHLIRSSGVLVLVDGYNVTMTGWPELPAAEQRAKLVRSLDGLAARTCSDLEVVFDGAEVEPLHMTPPAPPDVRVRFSPPDVEADDVLLELLGQIPPARPVVVVSSDNRVRAGAREKGANLLHSRQLLELL